MMIILAIVAVAALASLAMGRMYSHREHEEQRRPTQAAPTDFDARVERIAQAVDVIAAELERISENQRTLTKVLADRRPVDKRIGGD
jgi:hypothetical protein